MVSEAFDLREENIWESSALVPGVFEEMGLVEFVLEIGFFVDMSCTEGVAVEEPEEMKSIGRQLKQWCVSKK